MFAGGILRAGIFTLFISTTLLAETIPFDYWYGRIVGGHQTTLEYTDSPLTRSIMQFSQRVGDRGDFDVAANRFLRVWPGRSAWPTAFEPRFSGKVQLSKSLRLDFPTVDYHWSQWSRSLFPGWEVNDSTLANIEIGLTYLRDGKIRFDEERSSFLYLEGPFLAKGQTNVAGAARFTGRDNSSYKHSQFPFLSFDHSENEESDRSYALDVSARRGYSDNLVLGISGNYLRVTKNQSSSSIELWPPAGGHVDTSAYTTSGANTGNEARFAVDAQYLFSPNAWFTGFFQYRHVAYKRVSEQRGIYSPMNISNWESQESFGADLRLRFNYLSKSTVVKHQELLDNFSGYYDNQLESGTWSLEATAMWSVTELQFSQYSFRLPYFGPDLDYHDIGANANLRYHAFPNLFFEIGLSFQTQTDSVLHLDRSIQFQQLKPRIGLNYQSYTWNPQLRRDISWDQVSDIDYVLGPQLRGGDWRVSAFVMPPYKKSAEVKDWGWLPGSSHLTWKDDWTVGVETALGVCCGVETGLIVSWSQVEKYRTYGSGHTREWFLTPSASVQMKHFLRLHGSFRNHYRRDDYSLIWNADYVRDWTLALKVDVFF